MFVLDSQACAVLPNERMMHQSHRLPESGKSMLAESLPDTLLDLADNEVMGPSQGI